MGQIFLVKIDIFPLNAPIWTSDVSMLELAITECFKVYFGLFSAIFLFLGSAKFVYFFLEHPEGPQQYFSW